MPKWPPHINPCTDWTLVLPFTLGIKLHFIFGPAVVTENSLDVQMKTNQAYTDRQSFGMI